jgi:hypothetical protein
MTTQADIQTQKTINTLSTKEKYFRSDWIVFLLSAFLGAVMLWYAGSTGTTSVKFVENIGLFITKVFGSMFLVSLFVERVIEVFVFIWCDRQSAVHEQNLDYWQARQGRLKQDIQALVAERQNAVDLDSSRKMRIDDLIRDKSIAIDEYGTNADNEEKALLPFQARKRKVSTWIGLVIGIFTSAVGFRFLSQIVELDAAFTKTNQYMWFVAADVLLTGAVLAGGSKLVHQIFSVYDSFMESSKKSFSNKSNQ